MVRFKLLSKYLDLFCGQTACIFAGSLKTFVSAAVILDLSCPFSVKVSPLTVYMAFIVRKSTVTDMEMKLADLRRYIAQL